MCGEGEIKLIIHMVWKNISSNNKYILVGSPVDESAVDESQSGSATLFKHDEQNKKFRCLKKFYCPFSQNGLALEMRQDHNDLLLKEISDVLLGSDYSLNDQFGNSLQIDETICAIGSPRSHIRGTPDEHRTVMYSSTKKIKEERIIGG